MNIFVEHSKPIFQVLGVRNATAIKVIKLMQRDRRWLFRRLEVKYLTSVGRNHPRQYASTIRLCNYLVNNDLQVGERSKKHLHERLHTLATRSLTGRERNILPIRGHGFALEG